MENNLLNIALTATLAGLALHSQTSFAQQQSIEKIEVTGSHIKRSDMEGPSPVTSISAEDIAGTGVTDLISLFTKLPISGQGTFSTQANSSDDTANGGSSVSLRGLGADSTLILVNGRRISVSPFAKNIQTAFVDINNIPLSAIKRVDILKDGASATYGSDAIAGVINVVLRDDFDGVEISAKLGDTSDGGGKEENLSLVWGSTSDKASHTLVMDYFNREEVLYGDRHYSRTANQSVNVSDGVDFRSSAGIPGTPKLNTGAFTAAELDALTVSNPDAFLWYADQFGNDRCAAEDIVQASVGSFCSYDYAAVMSMFPQTERFSFNYMGQYEVSDNIRAFAELNGQSARTVIMGAGSPGFDNLFMDADNVNHPFADDPSHPLHNLPLTMRRRTVEIGNRQKNVDTDYYRVILGMEGEFGAWNWEAAYSYIGTKSVERGVDGFPNLSRTQEAIDSGLWNPFEPSSNSQEALDFIETTSTRVGKSTMKFVDFTVSGPVMAMTHGEMMLAIGGEYREESISDNPDEQFLRGDIFGTEATQANGERDNTSLYAELMIPLMDSFELQLAVRYENYSDFGTTTDPKIAFLWNPTDKLTLRGSYGTAFKAPSLHQLGLGRTNESPTLIDSLRCQAVNIDCDLREYIAIFEGNPELEPEESTNYNLGAIYEFSEVLSVGLDYYNYDIDNIIDSDTQFVLSNFGLDAQIVPRRPSNVPNDPGEVIQINDGFQNIGDLKTSGVDFDVDYRFETSMGEFKASYVLNYVLNFEEFRPDASGSQRLNRKEGDFEQPEVRWTAALDWQKSDWSANFAINYIGEFTGDASSDFGHKTVDAMTTVDARISYLGLDNMTLTLGATNLLNEEPPFSHHDFMGFVTGVHSGQGRFVYGQARYRF